MTIEADSINFGEQTVMIHNSSAKDQFMQSAHNVRVLYLFR